jgi:hypothetical protein
MFYNNPITGAEWYAVEQIPNGMWKAVCTRATAIYPLGTVNWFCFDLNEGIHKVGKFRPSAISLTGAETPAAQRQKNLKIN